MLSGNFKIEYTDPATGQPAEREVFIPLSINALRGTSPTQQVYDLAYSVADKGYFDIYVEDRGRWHKVADSFTDSFTDFSNL